MSRPAHGLAAIAALALLAPLSGCAAGPSLLGGGAHASVYTSIEDYRTAASTVFTGPAWVPDTATTIRVKTREDVGALLSYSPAEALPAECTGETAPEVPDLLETWWPTELPTAVADCDDGWHAFHSGTTVYAYTAANVTP